MSGTQRAWGVTYAYKSSKVIPSTIRRTREEAITAGLAQLYNWVPQGTRKENWQAWKSRGCRAVRVTITIEES